MRHRAVKLLVGFVGLGMVWAGGAGAAAPPDPAPVATAGGTAAPLALDLGGGVTLALAPIPAGTFLMGSPEDEKARSADEGPQHEVAITRPFWMGVTPVTQEQYERVMGVNVSVTPKGGDHPVDGVRWEQAVEFCETLAKKTGRKVRLPTEAEFEYATRAGTTTRYHFGDDPDYKQLGDHAWWARNLKEDLPPVGRKKPNAWGLHDTYGILWQWCSDWHGDYPAEKQIDPQGPATGTDRVLRGGAWLTGPHTMDDKIGRMLPRSALRGVAGAWCKWPPPGSAAKLGRGYTEVGRIGFRVVVEE